jgi:soluble lytic murein transglycosylase-like protein
VPTAAAAAGARRRLWWRRAVALAWTACLLAGLGTGLLLAAPEQPAVPENPPPVDARAVALARAFGPPCSGVPASPLALPPPLADLYTQFVRARCQAAAGKLDEAAQGFRAGLSTPQAVPTLWRWERVQALVLAGKHDAALQELELLLQADAEQSLLDRVRALITALTLQPGSAPPSRHMDYLMVYLEHVEPQSDDYDLLLRLWELAGEAHDRTLRDSVALLLWRNPKDEESAKRWAALPGTPGPSGPFPATAADYYGRAERLFSLGMFEQLAHELENPSLPKLDTFYAKGLGRLYFRALIRGNLLQQAAVQVNTESVMQRYAFDRRQQLIWAIRIQLKRRLIGPVLKYLAELEEISPKDDELPTIFLELLKYNQGRHDAVTMMHWLDRVTQEFPGSQEASDAYWQVIWDWIEHRDYKAALPLLERAIKHGEDFHPVDQARLYYWRGRLQTLQGKAQAGAATWKEMEERWPYGYYTALAQWKRSGEALALVGDGAKGSNGHAPRPVPAPEVKVLWNTPPYPQALFAFCVGEADLGVAILRNVVAQRLSDDAMEEAGAVFFYLERHYLQLRLLANNYLDTMRHSKVQDTPLWKRAFPRPHWDVVERQAEEQHIDPYFVLAIMREESRFFSAAYSHAGAKGLMQLMPSTARMVAKRNGLPYDEEQMHSPEFNIPIGVIYLKRVLERFDGNPLYAAAAYNAGPGNVQRWVSRYGKLPLDEFVERIPFGETQRYVKRVFLSYIVYTQLYR